MSKTLTSQRDDEVARLTDLEQTVVRLALLDGLTNEEIASALDTSYIAVACALNRAVKRIRARTSRSGYVELARLIGS